MAIDGYMVNGTAFVYVGTGAGNALQLLGYTDQGVEMSVDEFKEPIMTDLYGNRVPQDYQDMGMSARITVNLIACDRTVLASVIGRGDRSEVGEISQPGLVLGMSGYAFGVAIASPADYPWVFYSCLMSKGFGTRLATKANPFRCDFQAWPFSPYTATTGKNATLWTRVLA